ncbi:putative reverse transcriptase domain-containing protein [Tanacetum coccineum]
MAQAYAAGTGEKKEYAGTLPLCNRCKLYHNGPCTVKYGNCKKIGHMTQDCRNPAAARNKRTLTCYECGNPGHYMSDCPELKNQNHGNQAKGTRSHGLVHALGGREADQDLNDMEDDIREVRFGKRGKLNPRYVGPFKVLEKVGSIAYKLELPQELSRVHNTFHFVEEPIEITDHEVKRLKRSRILLVKEDWLQDPDYRNPTAARSMTTRTCYECGESGHYKCDCPLQRIHIPWIIQAEGTGARGLVHALGGGEADQYFNNMEDDISA